MASEITEVKGKHPVPALFEQLGIKSIKSTDRFSVTYRDGFLKAHVKRASGKSETAFKYVKGSFSGMTTFDPDQMNLADRNKLIRKLYTSGTKQKDLEGIFGLTQPMISKIVNS